MFARPALLISVIQAALLLGSVEARIWLLEREGRAIFARRFGQVQPAVLKEIASACGGGVCDALADEAVAPLLAGQPECSQQDMADKIIDTSRQFDAATQVKMIAAAVRYRETEKNTPPDFSANPPTLLNSVFCQKAPKNNVLRGLVQAQDPANDPNLFYDPATKATVTRGSQSNTFPFRANVVVPGDQSRLFSRGMMDGTDSTSEDDSGDNMSGNNNKDGTPSDNDKGGNMKDGNDMNGDNKNGKGHKHNHHGHKNNGNNKMDGNSKNDGGNMGNNMKSDDSSNDCGNDNSDNLDGINGNNGTNVDDGSQNNNGTNLDDGSNSNNGTNLDDGSNNNNGTNLDNGNNNNGTNLDNGNNNGTNLDDGSNSNNGTNLDNGNNSNNGTNVIDGNNNNGTVDAGNIGNFGSCSVPEIQFGAGFDGRRETSFEPVDKVSYNHGSAQNIGIITQFMCDQLVNTCKADDTAKSTCAKAKLAAGAAPPKTGKQADAFNAVFGKVTNFASVTALDDQGNSIAARSLRRRLLNVLRRVEGYLEDA